MTTDTSATDRAQQAASTAAEEGRHVAGTAADEAKQVAGQAAQQARSVVNDALGQATSQAQEQARTQRDRLVSTLGSLGEDLDGMAQQAPAGLATDLTRQAADQVRSLSSRLDGREPGELLDDVRRFARQRPGTFLLGALAAGVVAGRLLRGASDGIAGAAAAPSTPTAPSASTAPTIPAAPMPPSPPTPPTQTSAFASGTGSLGTDVGVTGGAVTGDDQPPSGTATTNPPMPSATPGQPTQPSRDELSGNETGYSGGGLSSEDRP
ncbi:hypothetical protein G6553_13455 [Nocardioides sp. IC4_145]|uniref:hypothetical protein n=1 Tax=Nocardioides sp. IC4_145 TaxID=2714037 RepID=UPI001408A125|nr:hypothetical protein [Nocardioides sp. IC4_145]NHC24173.1 hypothetical protein [Nocardioides sp. IC4_145]